jgi:aldose 1-epimerase
MKTTKQYCFTNSSGEDIYLFGLLNNSGTEVFITNYGAIITAFKIKQSDGTLNDIVLGFDNVADYFSQDYLRGYPYFGAAIGRYCNRIKNALFKIDGIKYSVSKNKGNDHLHGGLSGFDKKLWQLVSFSDSPVAALELKCKSASGEEGYPGNLETTIRFELNDEDELTYRYTATSDQPTAINLTHHSYFNLDNGKGAIEDHQVKIYASTILEQDDNFVANGNLISVENSIYDFRKSRRINERWNKEDGYDQSFVIDNKSSTLSLVSEAFSQMSKTRLQVFSTEPVVHFYTGKWIPFLNGKNGYGYGPFSGFCFETHKHPNAINIPHFPNTILRPGEIYSQETVYKIFQV